MQIVLNKDISQLVNFFSKNKFFSDFLNENGMEALSDCYRCLKYEHIKKGNYVMRQGDYGDTYYIILQGNTAVLVNMEVAYEWTCEPPEGTPADVMEKSIKDFISNHIFFDFL